MGQCQVVWHSRKMKVVTTLLPQVTPPFHMHTVELRKNGVLDDLKHACEGSIQIVDIHSRVTEDH